MIEQNKVVGISYTLTNDAGEVLDQSPEGQPLTYLAGAGNIIPGLEKALEGKAVGDQVNVTIPAAEAYGDRNPDMVQEVPRSAFQGVDDIQVGMQFNASGAEGQQVSVMVVEVAPETVTVDANHPLAGQDLTFDVKIESVADADEAAGDSCCNSGESCCD